jgi:hypothetical protein
MGPVSDEEKVPFVNQKAGDADPERHVLNVSGEPGIVKPQSSTDESFSELRLRSRNGQIPISYHP